MGLNDDAVAPRVRLKDVHPLHIVRAVAIDAVAVPLTSIRPDHRQVQVVDKLLSGRRRSWVVGPYKCHLERNSEVEDFQLVRPGLVDRPITGLQARRVVIEPDQSRRGVRQRAVEVDAPPTLDGVGAWRDFQGVAGSVLTGRHVDSAVNERGLDQRARRIRQSLSLNVPLTYQRGRAGHQRCGHAGAAVVNILGVLLVHPPAFEVGIEAWIVGARRHDVCARRYEIRLDAPIVGGATAREGGHAIDVV